MFVFVIIRPPPRSTRTDTLCPYTRSSDLVTPSVTPAGTVSVDGPVHVPPRSRRTRSPDADAASADEIDAPEATVRSVMSAAHPSEPSQIQIRFDLDAARRRPCAHRLVDAEEEQNGRASGRERVCQYV